MTYSYDIDVGQTGVIESITCKFHMISSGILIFYKKYLHLNDKVNWRVWGGGGHSEQQRLSLVNNFWGEQGGWMEKEWNVKATSCEGAWLSCQQGGSKTAAKCHAFSHVNISCACIFFLGKERGKKGYLSVVFLREQEWPQCKENHL